MSNEIVRMHNDLIDLPLKKFTASEINILNAICRECNEKDTSTVVLQLNDVRKLADFNSVDNERFFQQIKNTNKKLMSLDFTITYSKRHFVQFVLFPLFEVDDKNGTLTVRVNEDFKYILNSFSGDYTSIELQESASLKSAYSKQIYKKLRKFRNTPNPFWKVRIDDFKEYLDVPKSYRVTNIDQFVITPAIEELTPYFTNLKCKKWYDKKQGQRGRPSVAGYEWTFVADPKSESAADKFKSTGMVCPDCGCVVYEIPIDDAGGIMLGHKNEDRTKTGCSRIFESRYELKNCQPVDVEPPAEEVDEAAAQEINEKLKTALNFTENGNCEPSLVKEDPIDYQNQSTEIAQKDYTLFQKLFRINRIRS